MKYTNLFKVLFIKINTKARSRLSNQKKAIRFSKKDFLFILQANEGNLSFKACLAY